MAMVVVDGGLTRILDALLTYLDGLTLRLYKNNVTPAKGDTAGSYTQSTFTGYAAQNFSAWTSATLNGSSQGQTTHPTLTFTCSGGSPENIYGYYVVDGSGNLIFAERYSGAPFSISSGGSFAVAGQFLTDDL